MDMCDCIYICMYTFPVLRSAKRVRVCIRQYKHTANMHTYADGYALTGDNGYMFLYAFYHTDRAVKL